VPKCHLPNYREFYEALVRIGQEYEWRNRPGRSESPVRHGSLVRSRDLDGFIFHVEICEDLWAPASPSDFGALVGALILTNLSASNIVVGKADSRRLLCQTLSGRCWAAYSYSAAGYGESTTDLAKNGAATGAGAEKPSKAQGKPIVR